VEATVADRVLAKQAARALRELGAGSPADVVAAGALVERGAALVCADGAAIAAPEAFHLPETNFHVNRIGSCRGSLTPRTRDA
jgi:hypothetical protein